MARKPSICEIGKETIEIGESLDDAFVWIFYGKNCSEFIKYFNHPSAGLYVAGIGGKGELEFIDRESDWGTAMYFLLDKPTGVTYELKPVQAIIDAYAQLGAPGFSRMLGLMAGAWHGAQVSLTGGMISGTALFLDAHEHELDDYTAIQRLSATDPAVIAQLAQVDGPPLRYARLIRQKYNEWPSGERIRDYIEQICNPYCYRHGKYVVNVGYECGRWIHRLQLCWGKIT